MSTLIDNQTAFDDKLFPKRAPRRMNVAMNVLPLDAELVSDPPSPSLIATIRERGILHDPLLVRLPGKKYHVVAGNRRIKAARICGQAHVHCLVFPIGTTEYQIDTLIENDPNQRRGNMIGNLMAIRELRSQGLTDSQILAKTKMPRGTFNSILQLERLIDPLLVVILKDEMKGSVAVRAARLPESAQYELLNLLERRRVDFANKPKKIRINIHDVMQALRVKKREVFSALSLGLDDIPTLFGQNQTSDTHQEQRPAWCSEVENHLAQAKALIPTDDSPYTRTMRTLIEQTVEEIKQQVYAAVNFVS